MNHIELVGLEPLIEAIIEAIVEAVASKVIKELSELTTPRKALSTKQVAERFNMSETLVKELFRQNGSPAFRIGDSDKSPWRVDAEDFKKFLQKNSENFKG